MADARPLLVKKVEIQDSVSEPKVARNGCLQQQLSILSKLLCTDFMNANAANCGLFKIKVPGNGPFAGLSRPFRGPMFSFRGDKPVLKNLFPSPNEGSTMYALCFKSFRRPFAMQCFPFALDLQNLPLFDFKTGNLERLPIDGLSLSVKPRDCEPLSWSEHG